MGAHFHIKLRRLCLQERQREDFLTFKNFAMEGSYFLRNTFKDEVLRKYLDVRKVQLLSTLGYCKTENLVICYAGYLINFKAVKSIRL
jgi:hypothetical protein